VTTPTSPARVDIEELTALAKAAFESWAHNENGWYAKETLQSALDDGDDAAFIAAANPSVVLALLQEIRESRAVREDLPQLEACADLVLMLHRVGATVGNRNRVELLGEWVEARNAHRASE